MPAVYLITHVRTGEVPCPYCRGREAQDRFTEKLAALTEKHKQERERAVNTATEKLRGELQNPGADIATITARHAQELRELEARLVAKHKEELKFAIEMRMFSGSLFCVLFFFYVVYVHFRQSKICLFDFCVPRREVKPRDGRENLNGECACHRAPRHALRRLAKRCPGGITKGGRAIAA